jgi:hypothetical protein
MVCEAWVWHQGTVYFIDGSVTERMLPVGPPMFFQDARSHQMEQFVRNETGLRKFCDYLDNRDGLRCVGFWSSQEEIDAVHHYACLFAQEAWEASRVWMPYWFRDARLNGAHRVAYLIKDADRYRGAVMMDALGYHSLAWVWLTPKLRRRGIFANVWHLLERSHPNFKVLAPLSEAMQFFLKSEDPTGSHEVVLETGGPNHI